MVRVARSSACKAATGCVGRSLGIEPTQGDGRIEGLKSRQIKLVEDLFTDARAERVIGVGGDADPSPFLHGRGHFESRYSLHVRKSHAQAEKMAIGCGDLDAGNDQEAINRKSIRSHQSCFGEMGDGVAGVVVGDRDAAQAALFCCLNHGFGRAACIRRVMGVEMQVKGVAHGKKG